jgi:hypothetical protein
MSRRSRLFRDKIVQGSIKQTSGSGSPKDRWSSVKPSEQVAQDITPSGNGKNQGTKGAGERCQKRIARAKDHADRIIKQLVTKY